MHGPCHNIKYLIYNNILLNGRRFWRCKNGLLGEMPRSCLGKNGASCGPCLREHSAGSVRGAGDALRSPRRRSGSFFSHDCSARLFRTTRSAVEAGEQRANRAVEVPCRRCVPRPVAAAAQRDSGVRPDAGRYASQHAWPRWRAPAQITVKSCGLPPLGDRLVPVENCSARVSLPISTSHQVSTWLVVSKDHLPVLVTAAPVLT